MPTDESTTTYCSSQQSSCYAKLGKIRNFHRKPCPPTDGFHAFYNPFKSISVISSRWKGISESLCAMAFRLRLKRILLPSGFNLYHCFSRPVFNSINSEHGSKSSLPVKPGATD